MTSRAELYLDGVKYEPMKGSFGIRVQTEAWNDAQKRWLYGPDFLEVDYWVEIVVDEDSGCDGAAAPDAHDIQVPRGDGHYPLPPDLPGLVVDDQDDDWDAWYGNDAPELMDNRMAFLGWQNGCLTVEWRADYGAPLHFKGPLRFEAIHMEVKAEDDADRFFVQVFGEGALARVVKRVGKWQELGPSMPEDRRRWLGITFELADAMP